MGLGDFCLICDACSWRYSFIGRVCVSSCRCCVFVFVVHPVAILSAVFCVICSLLMFVSDASGDHMVETYLSMGLLMALYVARNVSFCFHHAHFPHRFCVILSILHTLFYRMVLAQIQCLWRQLYQFLRIGNNRYVLRIPVLYAPQSFNLVAKKGCPQCSALIIY